MSDMSVNSGAGRHITQDYDSAITGADQKAQTANLEQKEKVGSEQHQKTMNFLADKLAEMVQQDQKGNPSQQKSDSPTTPNKGAANQAPDTGAANQSGQTGANPLGAESEASFEATKKMAQNQTAETKDAPPVASESLAGQEGASSEELKKAKRASVEASSLSGASSTSSNSGSTAADGSTDLTDNLVGQLPGWGPPNPPAPELPPGFSLDSIAGQTARDHEAVLAGLMAKMSEMMSDEVLKRVAANSEHAKKSNEVTQAEIKTREADHIESARKAKEAQQIGGALIFLVSMIGVMCSIAALVTGGASMGAFAFICSVAFASIGSIDLILTVAEQPTIMGTIMEPIISDILMPMLKFFVESAIDILAAFGLPPDIAEGLGAAFGILWTITVVVGVFYVGKGVAGAVFGKSAATSAAAAGTAGAGAAAAAQGTAAGGKVVTALASGSSSVINALKTQMGRLAQFWEDFATKLNFGGSNTVYKNAIASGAGTPAAEAAKKLALESASEFWVSTFTNTGLVVGVVGAAGGGGANMAGGYYQYEAQMSHEFVTGLLTTLDANQELLTDMNEILQATYERSQEMMQLALSVYQNQQQTASSIINNMAKGM